jgi:penicillin-binding protein 1A
MSEQYRSRQARKRNSSTKKEKQNKPLVQRLKKVLMLFVIIGMIGAVAGGITVFSFIAGAPKLELALLEDPLSSKVYDINGEVIADLGMEKRTQVSYNEIPTIVKDAFIAVEDVRFYDHIGIDFRRIIGAAVANVTEGFGAEGGSTITQQVVKQSFLSPEKSLKRKVQEAWLSVRLEQRLSKEQILQIYLNKIYFSKSAYGVAKAAETYFGKELDELDIHEAALLAGMPQSPNRYNPFTYPEAAKKRRNIVLNQMEKNEFITAEQAEEARNISVESTLVESVEDTDPYSAFLDQVINEVQELGDIDVYSAGLEIYTTFDPKAQEIVNRALNTDEFIKYPNEDFQAGIILTDTTTGEIRAIGGGRNQKVARGLNYATDDNKKQPGSTIKPILDYGPAIEHLKWSTYEQIVDEKYTYSDGTPIRNWDNEYWGKMSIRRALEWSRNIPALKTLQEVGLERAQEFGTKLGLQFENPIYESDAIGGSLRVSPMDLAGAYSAFGNNGVYMKPHTVKKVVFPDERVIENTPEPQVAMSDYTAFMITDMLKTVVRSGTGTAANVPGYHIAGKTGTTNFDEETKQKYNIKSGGVPDIWFAGYSPNYTMAVWTGYSKTSSEHYIYGDQKNIAKQLFKVIMGGVHEGVDAVDFKKPDSVVRVAVEKGSDPAKLPSEFTPENEIVYEYFVKGTEPTAESDRYQQIDPPKDIIVEYDQNLDQVVIRWDYDFKDDGKNISFVVNQAINGEENKELKRTKEMFVIVEEPEKGSTYNFELSAVNDNNKENRSEATQLSIDIPEEEDDDKLLDLFPDDGEGQEDEGQDKDKDKEEVKEKDKKEEQNNDDEEKNNDSEEKEEAPAADDLLEGFLPRERTVEG